MSIYDLGSLDPAPGVGRSGGRSPAPPTAPLRPATVSRHFAPAYSGFDLYGTASLILPGTGQMLRGEFALGLFYLSSMGFVAALIWAIVMTLERVTETLRTLEVPGAAALWGMAVSLGVGVLLHLANILSASGDPMPKRPHPIMAGLASVVLPGWGQVLNGSYRRACLVVCGAWIVAVMWILALPVVHERLAEVRLFIPDQVLIACQPAVRFTAPVVVWALALYDAVATATARRRG